MAILNLSTAVRLVGQHPFAQGGQADIHQAQWTAAPFPQVVAVKIPRVPWTAIEQPEKKRIWREARIWSRPNHPNITPFYGVVYIFGAPALVMPYYQHGDFESYLRKYPRHKTYKLQLVSELGAGLFYLHSLDPPVVHGDIKGSNILIDDAGGVRIADFGLSRALDGQALTTEAIAGTYRWMAPELFATNDTATPIHTMQSDVWAFGMTVFEILTGRVPYNEIYNELYVVVATVEGRQPARVNSREIDDVLWDALKSCWSLNPSRRPSMRALALFFDIVSICGPDAFKSIGQARLILEEDPETALTDSLPAWPYPCKWSYCDEGFATLDECKIHEVVGHGYLLSLRF